MSSTETFVGFWPAREEFGEVSNFGLENGVPDEATRKELRRTLLHYEADDWKMKVACDYLCLLHLPDLQAELDTERSQPEDLATFSLRATAKAWPRYLEALNAWYFLLYAAAFTIRGQLFLHDFAELSFWNCASLAYMPDGTLRRYSHYGRRTAAYLLRDGKQILEKAPALMTIDHGIFDDAAAYWGTIFSAQLVSTTALATKILHEHRIRNHRAAVALAWFELEAWACAEATRLGFPRTQTTKKGKTRDRNVSDVLKDFPAGTAVGNMWSSLDQLRGKRNAIVHDNAPAGQGDSELALECFVKMLNTRSGLALTPQYHMPPLIGL